MAEWLWGVRAVSEVVRGSNREVQEVWIEAGPSHPGLEAIAGAAADRGVVVREVDSTTFAGLGLADAQRVAARCGPFRYREEAELPEADPSRAPCLVVVLDHLEDPQNLGAILRTAEATGCAAVCIPRRRAASVTPAVVRASAGASEHVPVHRVGNVARTVERLREGGYWTVALQAEGAEPWHEVDLTGCIGLVVGSEGDGVARLVGERCDFRVALPMLGQVGSLNAGAAFAAVAYEVVRQQLRARRSSD